jgi:MFS family permease
LTAAGQIKVFQQTMWPTCFKAPYANCDQDYILHLANYIQICGIIAGMLFWGALADYTGRKWGSRSVAAIMLSGVILLVFTGWATWAYEYFIYFMVAQTW